ncbi:hypothetical protein H6F98_30375 [Microcoleus sp. FACHB-SPT15]|uniref:hypothetical protein n=1 Tax=Microcoleus sp. FACHB-SPT15 TaxID=2692830 RepID=UPI001782DFF2|nr:hypothetical protein [Microcoleus sp. FACHB-SPT15]MBD1809723.1 hypothetical protein [Microcoleus sp. FACHB-SPT15]
MKSMIGVIGGFQLLSTGHPKRGLEFTVATTTGNRLSRGRIPNPINDEWYLVIFAMLYSVTLEGKAIDTPK